MPLRAIQNFYADDLTEADRSKEFRCPICGDEMIPVLPKEDIAVHFRHKNNEAHGEPETSQHIFGKRSVWRKAIDLGLESSLETRVGENIADVVVEKVVVEVQCSLISESEIKKREKNYRNEGFSTLWILGGEYYKRTQTYHEKKGREGIVEYRYQTLSDSEKRIMLSGRQSCLYYFDKPDFYRGNFQFKFKRGGKTGEMCKKRGWYDLEDTDLGTVLENEARLTLSDLTRSSKSGIVKGEG